MDPKIRAAIARLEVRHGDAVVRRGTACFVARDVVLTALHVVADRTTDPPAVLAGTIELTFPDHAPVAARVLDGRWDALEDWVLLALTSPLHPLVGELEPATLGRDGDAWASYGFPDAEPDGLSVHGTVTNSNGELFGGRVRAYQLYCQEAASGVGMRVKGLSGAPVVVDDAVVGVLRRSPVEGEYNAAGTLFACPVSLIAARCPQYFPGPLRVTSLATVERSADPPLPTAALRLGRALLVSLLGTVGVLVGTNVAFGWTFQQREVPVIGLLLFGITLLAARIRSWRGRKQTGHTP